MVLAKTLQRTLLVGLSTLLITAASSVATWSSASAATAHYYVALGDSTAYGYQPNGDWSHGYADQILPMLQQSDQNMSLVNMGCWGETTDTFIHGGCIGPNYGIPTKVTYTGSQLDTAKAFLSANGSSVKVVTVDVGLNDIAYNCFDPNTGAVDYTCVANILPVIHDNELTIVRSLQSVASPATKIVLGNAFDPFQNALPGTIQAVQDFNQVVAQVASETNTAQADIGAAFHLDDYPNGGNPYLCPANGDALTWTCINGDTHPTTAGYQLMAQTFFQAYETY